MPKRATIIDVARKVGLSKTTVACALSQNDRGKVAPEKQALIRAAAEELGYKPNFAAKSLSSKRGFAIGILMPISTSPIYGEMALQFQHLLWEKGYCGLFSFWGSYDAPRKDAIDLLIERNIDGVICWPGAESLIPKDMPAVRFHNSDAFDSVSFDYESVMSDCFEHLLALGHRKMGFIGVKDSARHKIFVESAARLGLPFSEEWLHFGLDATSGREGVLKMLESQNPPTAIMALNDSVAIAGMNAAHERGVSVPGELSFIGFDNMPESRLSHPSLTSFDLHIPETVKALVDVLVDRIANPSAPLRRVTLKPKLLARASTGLCAKP